LIDTAGQHAAGDDLEREGIIRGRTAATTADLCLWVVDGTSEPVWPETEPGNCLLVVNKSDLAPAWDSMTAPGAAIISARTGAGLADLCDRISRQLVPEPPPPGAAVPFTADLAHMVDAIATALAADDVVAVCSAVQSLASSAQPAPLG
jgi:tRNA modification GTPase